MSDDILAQSCGYSIFLTEADYKKHNELILLGSFMSQLLSHAYFHNLDSEGKESSAVSYLDALRELTGFFAQGKQFAKRWDALATDLLPCYQDVKISKDE